jgi:hypothetical protein
MKSMTLVGVLIAAALLVAGCGSGGSSSSATTAATPAEEKSAATGDIPDNQTFLLYRDPAAGYSIRYPEGWARKGSGNDVTFQEKANVIHLGVAKGAAPTEASAVKGVEALHKSDSTVKGQAPETLTLPSGPAVKITYSRMSAPDPVTGKRLPLVIDRYEYGHGGKVAVLDLATPVGVDNVDAYRMISESFKWQG